MPGCLTTHVLDTAQGRPAAEMAIELWRIAANGERELLRQTATNRDGRTDAPLLEAEEFAASEYELVFAVGEYFTTQGIPQTNPPFLGTVVLRFAIADAESHYHVPLLVSPWAYSTYRGS